MFCLNFIFQEIKLILKKRKNDIIIDKIPELKKMGIKKSKLKSFEN